MTHVQSDHLFIHTVPGQASRRQFKLSQSREDPVARCLIPDLETMLSSNGCLLVLQYIFMSMNVFGWEICGSKGNFCVVMEKLHL